MLTSNKERVFRRLVDDGAPVLSRARQLEIMRAAKTVRNVDYVSEWTLPQYAADSKAQQVTTRANWWFILTDISIWEREGFEQGMPRFNLDFESLADTKIFKDRTKANAFNLNTVPSRLCVGCEDLERTTFKNYHYEEPKDTLVIIPQRSVITVTVRPYVQMNGLAWNLRRGALMLSGLEVQMENTGVPNG